MIFSLVKCHCWRPWLAVNKNRTIFPHMHKGSKERYVRARAEGGAAVSSHVLKKENS